MISPVCIDFETFGIEGRPKYPPEPVGVAIKYPGMTPHYYAWGHPTENNCTQEEGRAALERAWVHPGGILCQNAKFDVDVAMTHCGMPMLPWDKIHDTMFLLFLDDPHQTELGLKPSSERLLDMPAEEQDAVGEWLLANQPVPGVKISKSKQSPHYFGRYIAMAPGDLVGDYAIGDVVRTEKLFDLLYPKNAARGMQVAYDRERRLMPILLDMERQGVPVDLERLRFDVRRLSAWHDTVSEEILALLNASSDLNLDSGQQLVEAMLIAGVVDTSLMPRTPTGKYQTNKEALLLGVTDKVLLGLLKYRTQLGTCLNTFMVPWLKTAEASGGLIFTTWNQIKSTADGGSIGTRTGRLSSTPNFQNIPRNFLPIFFHEESDPEKAKLLPVCPFPNLPELPSVRSYIKAWDADHVLIDRDYSQQELRILGHFENGVLMDAYTENPFLDVHDYARDMINKMTGKNFDRKPIKNTGFGLIYGMGIGKLALGSKVTVAVAKEVKDAYLTIFPGLKEMYQDMKYRAQNGLPIRTWGGREYYCEPPKLVDGRVMTFDYKMLNVLIQGSAADCTKEAIIRYWDKKLPGGRLILNVHDQITISVPRSTMAASMAVLKEAMESVEFDVQMLSEGAWTDNNWSTLEEYDVKGVQIYGN